MSDFEKYLKYKEKYLTLKKNLEQLGGNYVPLNLEQQTFHKLLNRMDETFWITGCSCVYQWHFEDEDKNRLKTVTLIGETHQRYSDFHELALPGLTLEEKGVQRTNLTIPNYGNHTLNLEEQTRFLIIEILWYLFKGTRRCLDFYLEDWKTDLSFEIKRENLDWNLDKLKELPYTGFIIRNLIKMVDTDIHLLPTTGFPPDIPRKTPRRELKKFENVRTHFTEFRVAEVNYILLPYSIPVHHEETVELIINDLLIDRPRLLSFFTKITSFFKLLTGVIYDGKFLLGGSYLNFNEVLKDTYPLLNSKYNEIIREYHYEDKFNEIKRSYPFYLGTTDFITERINELNYFRRIHKKIIKNLWKCDTFTIKKFKNFANNFNFSDLIIKLDLVDVNTLHLTKILRNITTNLLDFFLISRTLKTFNIDKQDKNLKPTSSCFNQNNISNRNILTYTGSAHTFFYYFFFRYYFGTLPNYSIKTQKTIDYDFNTFFSFYYEDLTRGRKINESVNDSNLSFYFQKTYYVKCINMIDLGKDIQFNSRNHINFNYNYQAFKNHLNIFQKILINLSKEKEERFRLIKNIDESNTKLTGYYQNLIEKNINGWFTDYLKFSEINDYQISFFNRKLPSNIILFNPKQRKSILYKYNLISKKFYNSETPTPTQSFLNTDIATAFPEEKINKLNNFLKGKLTDLISNHFHQSFESRAKFVKFVIEYFNSALKLWHSKRYHYYKETMEPVTDGEIATSPILKLVFKGGITIRLLVFSLRKQFTINLENELERSFGNNLKISDNDFEIKINFKGINVLKKEELVNETSLLSYLLIRDLTDIFNNPEFFDLLFDFNKIDFGKRQLLMKRTLDEINSIPDDVKPPNITRFDYLILNNKTVAPSNTFDLIDSEFYLYNEIYPLENNYQELKTIKTSKMLENNASGTVNLKMILPTNDDDKREFLINPERVITDLLTDPISHPKIEVIHLVKENDFLPELINKLPNTIKSRTNLNPKLYQGKCFVSYSPNINNSFSLARNKINFYLVGTYTDSKQFALISNGELVDLSVSRNKTIDVEILRDDDYENYLVNLEPPNNFNYFSYSLKGHILDIYLILFFQHTPKIIVETHKRTLTTLGITDESRRLVPFNLPWTDEKYEKRVDRLILLIMLESIQKLGSKLDRVILNLDRLLDIPRPTSLENLKGFYDNLITLLRELLGTYKFKRPFDTEAVEVLGVLGDRLISNYEYQNESSSLVEDVLSFTYEVDYPEIDLGDAITPTITERMSPLVTRRIIIYPPEMNSSFIEKFNSIRSINNLYGIIYLLIKWLGFFLYHRPEWDILQFNSLNETGQLNVILFLNVIMDKFSNIRNFLKNIKNSRIPTFPKTTKINPKDFS